MAAIFLGSTFRTTELDEDYQFVNSSVKCCRKDSGQTKQIEELQKQNWGIKTLTHTLMFICI